MSEDIVKRLRQPILVDVHPVSLHAETMRQAADEITRLRAELAAEREAKQCAVDQAETFREERDELREQYEEAIAATMRLAYELAAERLKREMQDRNNAERDELRELLRECRSGWYLNEELNARIAVALNKGGVDGRD